MYSRFILSLAILYYCACLTAAKNYQGYKLLSVFPENDADLLYLSDLESASPSLIFWNGIKRSGPINIVVPPENVVTLNKTLTQKNMKTSILIHDIQSHLDEHQLEHDRRMEERRNVTFPVDVYHTYEEISAWISSLAESSDLVTLDTIGKSYEGREQWYITITNGPPGVKPVNWIDCQIHASEWIGGSACVWYINELLTKYGEDAEITRIVDEYDWMILPVLNPDGYVYSHSETGDRLWRKTRAPNPGSECVGTDPNRNYDNHWGGEGSSDDPCSWSYRGHAPFSAEETQNHRDMILSLADRLNMLYMMHSAGQVWTLPYGWTQELPKDYDEMARVSAVAVKVATETNQEEWKYGSCANMYFLASGLAIDWVYEETGLIYSFILEMRPKTEQLIIPETEIIPNAQETWNGILAALKAIENQ